MGETVGVGIVVGDELNVMVAVHVEERNLGNVGVGVTGTDCTGEQPIKPMRDAQAIRISCRPGRPLEDIDHPSPLDFYLLRIFTERVNTSCRSARPNLPYLYALLSTIWSRQMQRACLEL